MRTSIITTLTLVGSLLASMTLIGQIEYIGAGQVEGVTVTSSQSFESYEPANTINGSGMDADLMEASRFLTQATFGQNLDEVVSLNEQGIEAWIDEQLAMAPEYISPRIEAIWEDIFDWNIAYSTETYLEENPGAQITDELLEEFEDDIFGPWALNFHYAWYEQTLGRKDQLRQKMAYALSQLMVVSINSDLIDHAEALGAYYDIMTKHAFGNYRDLLEEVTLSPAMGLYLSHYNNPREIPEENLHPDENYAREIMQLFSIGLYELNQDGTRKMDANGDYIPTYDNDDIKELAKVFTGLGGSTVMDNPWVDDPFFGMDWYLDGKTESMKMYEEWHEQSAKTILGELQIPAGQSGMQDIEMALDFLFNHDNVGPFVSKQLIQRFVKSNPSPAYVSRIAGVFADNGQGVRGDLGAVIKAILLDEEARSCQAQLEPSNGKLSEPLLRFIQLGRAFPIECYKDTLYVVNGDTLTEKRCNETRLWMNGFDQRRLMKQSPLGAPSVFNFYLPDHQPVGSLTEQSLVAPEFKIHDASTSINYMNAIFVATLWNYYGSSWDNDVNEDLGYLAVETSALESLMQDPEEVMNYLDVVFLRGTMTDALRAELRLFVKDQASWVGDYRTTRGLLYLVMISPEFAILK